MREKGRKVLGQCLLGRSEAFVTGGPASLVRCVQCVKDGGCWPHSLLHSCGALKINRPVLPLAAGGTRPKMWIIPGAVSGERGCTLTRSRKGSSV